MARAAVSILLMLLLCYCRKEKVPGEETVVSNDIALTRGVPPDPAQLDGYLCSTYLNSYDTIYHLVLYATFSDKKKNLFRSWDHLNSTLNYQITSYAGDVNTGRVSYNTYNDLLISSNSQDPWITYHTINYYVPFLEKATWTNDGYVKFKPFEADLSGSVPKQDTRKLSNGYQVQAGNNLVIANPAKNSSADSVFLTLSANVNGTNVSLTKIFDRSSDSVFIHRKDLAKFPLGWVHLNITTANYFYQVINDKTYLFEMTTMSQRTIWVKQ